MRKLSSALFCLAPLVVSGCEMAADDISGPDSQEQVQLARGADPGERPFVSMSFEVSPSYDVPDSTCPSGMRRMRTGTGRSNFGPYTFTVQRCTEELDVRYVMTFANGDQLWGSILGAATGPSEDESRDWLAVYALFSGGTGRFENASGYWFRYGFAEVPDDDRHGKIDGYINLRSVD